MANGIYVFNNADDFLKAIKNIEQEYQEKTSTRIVELNKQLFSTSELRKEIDFLNNCRLNSFMGFLTRKIIKVNITVDNCNYLITYRFKGSKNGDKTIYKQLHHYLKKREWQNIIAILNIKQ